MQHIIKVIFFVSISECLAEMSAPNYYCSDRDPQNIISMPNLAGLWFGIEKIFHESKQHMITNRLMCPTLFITEEKHDFTTYNPLYRTYNTNYGEGYQYYANTPSLSLSEYEERKREEAQRQRATAGGGGGGGRRPDWPYPRRTHTDYMRHHLHELKHLRLSWEEGATTTEYYVRYNASRPGFWISSGPNNGSLLEPEYSHFAGTIQVIKAIGSHMVLTFCHQLPETQLYTVILSRDVHLDSAEIHSIHRLLNRKGLSTATVQKLCKNGADILTLQLMVVIGLSFVCTVFNL